MKTHGSRRVRRSEKGAALVMITLSLVALVGVSGVVVDGSNAYAQRRQMQNAADSAALAGARALDRLTTNAESAIWTAVVASAQSNGASAAQVTCRIETDVLVDLGACPTTNTGTAVALRNAASAVHVTVGATTNTNFVRVLGIQNFTARASATAQIEGLRAGNSPFAICATGVTDPRSDGDGQAIPIIFPDNSMNPAAIGVEYELQDPTTIGCGQGNQWKGLTADMNSDFPVPGPWNLMNGDHGINVANAVAAGSNACHTIIQGCVILVPLCHAATPPVSGVLYCERFGAFQIDNVASSSRIDGILVDQIEATGGEGGGHAGTGEARVIKLSE
ncbi:MAG TPA: pilus assembly protein TadG-related protein [Acidimicrobiales bacterium]|nr:pilus assembly protein TadG-related protein [Acidimicrobiales bacterium]